MREQAVNAKTANRHTAYRAADRWKCTACTAIALLLALLALPGAAFAADISLIGLFQSKAAVVVIDGGAPKTIKVGVRSPEGVLLVAADKDTAVIEYEGKRKTLRIGQHHRSDGNPATANMVSLSADPRGHFFATGTINENGQLRMLVDTGASTVVIPEPDAQRMGLDYRNGVTASISTANGLAQAWRIRLDSVKIGDVSASNVDALVLPAGKLSVALLGMSFLNRFEMNREGETMTLRKRF